MKKWQWFYAWLVPLIWVTCSFFSYKHHGDEYGMYCVSSMAGLWIAFLVEMNSISKLMFPFVVGVTGGVVMTVIGFLMDRARIRKVMWATLWLIAMFAMFVMSIRTYPTIEKALRKNGSWWAYIFFSINMGLYFGILLSFIGRGVEMAWKKVHIRSSIQRSLQEG